MCVTICIIAEKGGVGKTTTTLELAYQWGAQGNKVLVVDMDQQANTTAQLLGHANHSKGIYDLFVDEAHELSIKEIVAQAKDTWPSCLVAPADRRLAKLPVALSDRVGRDLVLSKILEPAKDYFDFILIDTPPALGIGNVNALAASDFYLLPTDASKFGKDSIANIEEIASLVRETSNPKLKNLGVLVTLFQKGGSHGVREILKGLENIIMKVPHSTKLIEAQSKNTPISELFPDNSVSIAYKKLANHIGERNTQ